MDELVHYPPRSIEHFHYHPYHVYTPLTSKPSVSSVRSRGVSRCRLKATQLYFEVAGTVLRTLESTIMVTTVIRTQVFELSEALAQAYEKQCASGRVKTAKIISALIKYILSGDERDLEVVLRQNLKNPDILQKAEGLRKLVSKQVKASALYSTVIRACSLLRKLGYTLDCDRALAVYLQDDVRRVFFKHSTYKLPLAMILILYLNGLSTSGIKYHRLGNAKKIFREELEPILSNNPP